MNKYSIKEIYDVYANAKTSVTKQGEPIFVALEENGLPIIEDGKVMEGNKIFIPRVAYTEWFWAYFPNGAIVDELVEKTGSDVCVKVTLYDDRRLNTVLATSHGFADKNSNEYYGEQQNNNYPLAYYLALKGAMEKAGFIIDYSLENLKKVPNFVMRPTTSEVDAEPLNSEPKLKKEVKEKVSPTPAKTKEPISNTEVTEETREEPLAAIKKQLSKEEPEELITEETTQPLEENDDTVTTSMEEPETAKEVEVEEEVETYSTETNNADDNLLHTTEAANNKIKAFDGVEISTLDPQLIKFIVERKNDVVTPQTLEKLKAVYEK